MDAWISRLGVGRSQAGRKVPIAHVGALIGVSP
jgi:hypothetical protein